MPRATLRSRVGEAKRPLAVALARRHGPARWFQIALGRGLGFAYRWADNRPRLSQRCSYSGPVQTIARFSLLVGDYDEAIDFYTQKLGFELLQDTNLAGGKRWVRVAPPGGQGAELLLAKAATEEQRRRIGDQTGGRVFIFIETDDFWRDYNSMCAAGVQVARPPRTETYGTVAVLLDLYGNQIDLIRPHTSFGGVAGAEGSTDSATS